MPFIKCPASVRSHRWLTKCKLLLVFILCRPSLVIWTLIFLHCPWENCGFGTAIFWNTLTAGEFPHHLRMDLKHFVLYKHSNIRCVVNRCKELQILWVKTQSGSALDPKHRLSRLVIQTAFKWEYDMNSVSHRIIWHRGKWLFGPSCMSQLFQRTVHVVLFHTFSKYHSKVTFVHTSTNLSRKCPRNTFRCKIPPWSKPIW